MGGGKDGDPGSEKYMISNGHITHIQNKTVTVGKKMISDMDMTAVVAEKRGLDPKIFSDRAKELPKNGLPFCVVVRLGQPAQQTVLSGAVRLKLGIVGPVEHSRQHPLFLCHVLSSSEMGKREVSTTISLWLSTARASK